jgi:hypothetical protein
MRERIGARRLHIRIGVQVSADVKGERGIAAALPTGLVDCKSGSTPEPLTAGLSERYVEVDKNACGRASFQPNA